jgi:hypothetical protein
MKPTAPPNALFFQYRIRLTIERRNIFRPACVYTIALAIPKLNTMANSDSGNTKTFKSEKSAVVGLLFLGVLSFLTAIVIISPGSGYEHPGMIVTCGSVGLFFAWIWFGTYYKIDDVFLYYRSGPFRGKIEISSITEVTLSKAPWYGFRPALAKKGLIVKYGRWDEIYITPSQQLIFLNKLHRINPDILVRELAMAK